MGISKVQNASPAQELNQSGRMTTNVDLANGPSFQQTLLREIPKNSLGQAQVGGAREALRFSQHAVDRMKSRGIRMSPELMGKLEGAVSRAAGKGSKDALVLSDDSAFVVSVKNNTVVTVMDRDMMKENVFTNIDSTVLI